MEQQPIISIDYLIANLCKKDCDENLSEEATITQYNNDADILDLQLPKGNKEKILKGMLKEELVQLLYKHYDKKTTLTTLRKLKVQELISKIIDENVTL